MKIVIAPDSFKESLAARAVAQALAAGMARVLPEARFDLVPMADGGEGTVDALVAATAGRIHRCKVTGPLGEPVTASFGVLGDGRTAVIEMAAASGLALVPAAARDPMRTTSHGTGELIRHALDRGVNKLIVGLGGSATNDGGSGMLQALGVRFLGRDGRPLDGYMSGGRLAAVERFDFGDCDPRLRNVAIDTASDVDNPLTGPHGASATFGPQKGATGEQIVELDAALERFYGLAERCGRPRVIDLPGAGAAGGLGAALAAFLDASLRPGVEIVIEAVGLAARIRGAALVVTGEGCLDAQTLRGKAPAGVARVATAEGVAVVGVGGALVDDDALIFAGLFNAFEAVVYRPMTSVEALRDAERNLVFAGCRIAQWLRLAQLL